MSKPLGLQPPPGASYNRAIRQHSLNPWLVQPSCCGWCRDHGLRSPHYIGKFCSGRKQVHATLLQHQTLYPNPPKKCNLLLNIRLEILILFKCLRSYASRLLFKCLLSNYSPFKFLLSNVSRLAVIGLGCSLNAELFWSLHFLFFVL